MVFTQPVWLLLSFVVVILILTELKDHFISLSKKASEEEFITLAKFIAFAGVTHGTPVATTRPENMDGVFGLTIWHSHRRRGCPFLVFEQRRKPRALSGEQAHSSLTSEVYTRL